MNCFERKAELGRGRSFFAWNAFGKQRKENMIEHATPNQTSETTTRTVPPSLNETHKIESNKIPGKGNATKGTVVHDHWYSLIPNFTFSPTEFYMLIEKTLTEREVPGLEAFHVEMAEGGMLSTKRTYLRLTRERFVFDICAAPFGKGFFFSSRFSEIPLLINPLHVLLLLVALWIGVASFVHFFGFVMGILMMLAVVVTAIILMRNAIGLGLQDLDDTIMKSPVIGPIYERFFRKETFFREDTRLMYLQTVPEIVKQIVEEITATKGIKLLKQYETNAVLKGGYQSIVTRLNNEGPTAQPLMIVSMTPFANSPRAER